MESNKNLFYTLPEVSVDTPIMRYMKLEHLLNILDDKKFYVSLKKKFEDKNESSLPLKYMFPIYLANAVPPDEQSSRDLERMYSKLNEYKELKNIPTSCWTLKPHESYLFWKGYTSSGNGREHECNYCDNDICDSDKGLGVCIKTTIGNVVASLIYPDFDIFCGKMIYQNYSLYNDNEAFTKSIYFRGEEEFRFYFVPKDDVYKIDNHIELDVNPDVLINEVILSPFFKKSVAEKVANVLRARYRIECRLSAIELKINDEKE